MLWPVIYSRLVTTVGGLSRNQGMFLLSVDEGLDCTV